MVQVLDSILPIQGDLLGAERFAEIIAGRQGRRLAGERGSVDDRTVGFGYRCPILINLRQGRWR